jgi:hypothetical protein
MAKFTEHRQGRWVGASIYGVAIALLGESIAALFVDLQLPQPVLRILYPSLASLQGYCSAHPCLYGSNTIASLYVIQLLTLVGFAFLLAPVALSAKPPLPREVRMILGLVIVGALIDYLSENFSFAPKWLLPNSIAESPLGLFHHALWFSLAAVASAVLANGGRDVQVPRDATAEQ